MAAPIPNNAQPIAGPGGTVTPPWRIWLDSINRLQQNGQVNVEGLERDIAAILQALGADSPDDLAGFLRDTANVIGQGSIRQSGTLKNGAVYLALVGDNGSPGPTYYYGSNATGTKGWHPVADTVQAAAGELSKAVNSDGVTTFGLADLADSGTGTFKLLTRDAKGRLSGTADGDTDDVPEGGANLYHTTARARAAAVANTITDGVTDVAPSQNAVFDALALKDNDAKLSAIAQLSASQALANATTAKVNLDTETLDTDACFDTTTGRFTPSRAGTYLVTASVAFVYVSGTIVPGERLISYVFKNGAQFLAITGGANNSATNIIQAVALVPMNGTTDYMEMYARRDTTATYQIQGSATGSQFSAVRISA